MSKVYTAKEAFFKDNELLGTRLPFSEDCSVLGTPLQIGDVTFPNRLAC